MAFRGTVSCVMSAMETAEPDLRPSLVSSRKTSLDSQLSWTHDSDNYRASPIYEREKKGYMINSEWQRKPGINYSFSQHRYVPGCEGSVRI